MAVDKNLLELLCVYKRSDYFSLFVHSLYATTRQYNMQLNEQRLF